MFKQIWLVLMLQPWLAISRCYWLTYLSAICSLLPSLSLKAPFYSCDFHCSLLLMIPKLMNPSLNSFQVLASQFQKLSQILCPLNQITVFFAQLTATCSNVLVVGNLLPASQSQYLRDTELLSPSSAISCKFSSSPFQYPHPRLQTLWFILEWFLGSLYSYSFIQNMSLNRLSFTEVPWSKLFFSFLNYTCILSKNITDVISIWTLDSDCLSSNTSPATS